MIKLFWYPRSRASRALWMLEEIGQPFERVEVDLSLDVASRGAAFLAASPMGKVPAIEDGEVRLAESAAIGLYLADRYPQTGLAPASDAPERGAYLYWMTFTPAVLEPAMAEQAGGWPVNRTRNGWGDFATMIAVLSDALADGPWLLGESFSAADVLVGSSVYFLQKFGMLPADRHLEGYVQRCLQRPAYQKALAADQES